MKINDKTETKIRQTIGKLLDEAEDSVVDDYIKVIIDNMTQIAVYYNFTEREIRNIIDDSFELGIKSSNIRNFEKRINNNDMFMRRKKNDWSRNIHKV